MAVETKPRKGATYADAYMMLGSVFCSQPEGIVETLWKRYESMES
jgi:hypothetical protein